MSVIHKIYMTRDATPPKYNKVASLTQAHHDHSTKSAFRWLVGVTTCSLAGLRAAYQHERAFRFEVALAVLMIPAAFWLGQTWVEVALLAGTVMMVMAAELLNSAIEAVVDRISLDWHALSKRAKDLGSACVLVCLILTVGVWVSALVSRLSSP